MQLFARRYPDEIAGLLLVDAVYPRVIKKPEDSHSGRAWQSRCFFRVLSMMRLT